MENENLGHGRGKIIEELLRGRDLANQLRQVMNEGGDIDNNNNNNDGSTTTTTPFAEHLLKEVLMTFTNSLLFLKNPSTSESFDVSDLQLTKSEDSLESNCKSSILKERRGCYKRRKILQTWEKESEFPVEDGHQWRKYGQKKILHNDFPRNYFRCTHKHDQGCKATKQVQKIREEPPLHKTTYYGHHTCKVLLNPEIIVDSLSPSDHSSMFLSFDNSFPTPTKQDCPFLSSSVKRECKKEDNILVNIPPPPPPSSSNNDYLSELTFDESSTLDSDHLVVDIPHILYGSSGFDEVLNWTLS